MISKKYFAACNSTEGFISYFNDIFFNDNFSKRYIIKGGPGTGKSTLIKKLAIEADKRDCEVELYYCSSDPNSLDGAVIKDMGICIIDGTSPHSVDCQYPACIDNIVNMDMFWDRKKLEIYTAEIIDITKRCSAAYNSAYKILAAYGNLLSNNQTVVKKYIFFDKINSFADTYIKEFNSEIDSTEYRIVSSVNSLGKHTIEDLFLQTEKAYYIKDEYSIAPFIFDILSNAHTEKIVCRSPLLPNTYEAVYFTDYKILFSSNEQLLKNIDYTTVNTERFIKYNTELKSNIFKYEKKLLNELLEYSFIYFQKAKKLHDELEKIYISAMDFKSKEKWTDDFIISIFE